MELATALLTLEGLENPLDGDDAADAQSLLGEAGREFPLIGEAVVRGDNTGPSLLYLFN
jgi:hypothetical protein